VLEARCRSPGKTRHYPRRGTNDADSAPASLATRASRMAPDPETRMCNSVWLGMEMCRRFGRLGCTYKHVSASTMAVVPEEMYSLPFKRRGVRAKADDRDHALQEDDTHTYLFLARRNGKPFQVCWLSLRCDSLYALPPASALCAYVVVKVCREEVRPIHTEFCIWTSPATLLCREVRRASGHGKPSRTGVIDKHRRRRRRI
jgi:hypothetical protein